MARLEDNSLRNFLDSEFANSGSRNNLESGNTLERRDGIVKFVNRDFNLQWQKTDTLDSIK